VQNCQCAKRLVNHGKLFFWEIGREARMKYTIRVFKSVTIVLALCIFVSERVSSADLISYKVKDGMSIEESLTSTSGDPVKGRALSINRKKGNCLACHQMPIPEQSFHGNIGPGLVGAGERYTKGELRLRVVNPKEINEDTIMPAFYRNDGFNRTLKKFSGKTILSAEEVEDIVSYIAMLGEIYKIKLGDSLSKIAESNKTSLKSIVTLNPALGANPDKIKVGQKIVLPAAIN
jgi:sulfur-oxidizing protein SoxX